MTFKIKEMPNEGTRDYQSFKTGPQGEMKTGRTRKPVSRGMQTIFLNNEKLQKHNVLRRPKDLFLVYVEIRKP